MEETNNHINDEVAVDAAIDNQSKMTANESETLKNDQVATMEVVKQTMQSLSLLVTT